MRFQKNLKALTLGVYFLTPIMYNRSILTPEAHYEQILYG